MITVLHVHVAKIRASRNSVEICGISQLKSRPDDGGCESVRKFVRKLDSAERFFGNSKCA